MAFSSRLSQGANLGPGDFRSANPALGADDSSVAFIIKYVGTSASAKVTVSSGDIQLTHGAVGSEAADSSVGSNTAGSVDISDGDEDTVAEALSLINQSSNWIAVAVDCVGSDTIGTSALLVTMAATQAKTAKGVQVKFDTTAKLADSVLVAPAALRTDIRPYQATATTVDNMLPFRGTATSVAAISATSTYGSGSSTIQIIQDDDPTTNGSSAIVHSEASGSTTVNKTVDRTQTPFEGERSERVIVRLVNSAAQASVFLGVSGEMARNLS